MFRNAIDRLKETHLATRLDRWITGALAVLLVALGFIGGRWTSLVSHATPVVFQEAPGGSSEATPWELRALVTEKETGQEPATQEQQAPASAKASAGLRPSPKPEVRGIGQGAFVASVNGKKYYRPDCSEVRRIKEENKLWFDSEQEAKDSGYEPSVCVQKGK